MIRKFLVIFTAMVITNNMCFTQNDYIYFTIIDSIVTKTQNGSTFFYRKDHKYFVVTNEVIESKYNSTVNIKYSFEFIDQSTLFSYTKQKKDMNVIRIMPYSVDDNKISYIVQYLEYKKNKKTFNSAIKYIFVYDCDHRKWIMLTP